MLLNHIKNIEGKSITTSVDTSKVADPRMLNRHHLSDCDILFSTEHEAYQMTDKIGAPSIEGIVKEMINFGAKVSILKLGRKGSCLYRKDFAEPRIIQTYDVSNNVYNLNGAGDIFAATVISKLIELQEYENVSLIPDNDIYSWCENATEHAVEFITRPSLNTINCLKRYSEQDNFIQKKTKTTLYSIIMPERTCFETSDFNAHALEDATIPPEAQKHISNYLNVLISKPSNIVDLGCGGSWLPIRLARNEKSDHSLILCDIANKQIEFARANIIKYLRAHENTDPYKLTGKNGNPYTLRICDAAATGMDDEIADLVTMSFVIHMFDDSEKHKVASEMGRLCKKGGIVSILTFSPENIAKTLYHKYIEGFLDIDRERYMLLSELEEIFVSYGLSRINEAPREFEYNKTFDGVRKFVDHARRKPFSTFYLLQERLENMDSPVTTLDTRLDNCELEMLKEYGTGPVSDTSKVSLLLFRKD